MKIGYDAKRAFYNRTGLGNYSRNILEYLHSYFPENEYVLFAPEKSEKIDWELRKKLQVISPNSFISRNLQSAWRTFWIENDILKNEIDIYHGLSNEIPKISKKSKLKTVVTIHDLIFLRFPKHYKPIDRKIYNQKFRYACKNADKIVAISQQTKQDIVDFYQISEQKIEVIYQGCNSVFLQKVSKEKKQAIKQKYNLPNDFLLNVGTIEKRKNILSVIKAINQQNIDIPFVIVGKKTRYFDEIADYVAKNNLENKVLVLDKISFEDLPTIYQLAKIFIYPSVFEGFGIPVIEAVHSQIPVITSNVSSMPEAGGKNVFYANPHNIEEIGEKINKVLNNKDLAQKSVAKNLKYVQRFSPKSIATEMMKMYKNL